MERGVELEMDYSVVLHGAAVAGAGQGADPQKRLTPAEVDAVAITGYGPTGTAYVQ